MSESFVIRHSSGARRKCVSQTDEKKKYIYDNNKRNNNRIPAAACRGIILCYTVG